MVGEDGFPLSWKHYQYGMVYITRAQVRNKLETAAAVRAAGGNKKDYKQWRNDLKSTL